MIRDKEIDGAIVSLDFLMKEAEEEISILKPFLEKYGLELDYLKFFQNKMRLPLRICEQ